MFRPFGIEADDRGEAVTLEDEGLALCIPGTDGLAGLRLSHADGGRRLFGPRDIAQVHQLFDMLTAAAGSRTAYETGVLTERGRIARDLHDNVGAQLMTALHSPEAARKDIVIRETIAGLRDIIDDSAIMAGSWSEALADLRRETAERLHAAGLDLDWRVEAPASVSLDAQILHVLRSILREAVTNTLRHAEARAMHISISGRNGRLVLAVRDDGRGVDPDMPMNGNGLANMRARVEALTGSIAFGEAAPGFRVVVELPCWQGFQGLAV